MKRRLILLLTLCISCILIITGCSNPLTSLRDFFNKKTEIIEVNTDQDQEEARNMGEMNPSQPENSRATVLYYKDKENLLVPVMRYMPKGDLGVAKAALTALIYSEETAQDLEAAGLMPVLPEGTAIKGATIKENGLAIVDFSKEILNFDCIEAEASGVKAVVYTLTEFPNIKSVEIRVDGKKLIKMPKGTEVESGMKRTEINLEPVENLGEKLSKVVVYYHKKGSGQYSYFVPITKLVSGFSNSAEAAVDALLKGPDTGSSLSNPFPEGTQLLGVQVNGGTAYINFSEQILAKQGDKTAENIMIKATALTMKEFPEISKVKLFVNGKIIADTEGLGADTYISIPAFVNFYE